MKKIVLVGVLALSLVAIIAMVAAMNFGKASPAYAEGNISLSPAIESKAEFAKTLFLVVFEDGVPMPYGAMKIYLDEPMISANSHSFRITKERLRVMNENRPTPKKLRIKARLDLDGIAGADQPGDLVGEVRGVPLGAHDVEIIIDTYREPH